MNIVTIPSVPDVLLVFGVQLGKNFRLQTFDGDRCSVENSGPLFTSTYNVSNADKFSHKVSDLLGTFM